MPNVPEYQSKIGDRMDVTELQKEVHKTACASGWWGPGHRVVLEVLCLIHSEVSEACEAWRNNDKKKFAEELADIAIRLFDAAEAYGIDLESEIIAKNEINKKRPYRHGGKLA